MQLEYDNDFQLERAYYMLDMPEYNCYIVDKKDISEEKKAEYISKIYEEYDITTADKSYYDRSEYIKRSDKEFSVTIIFCDTVQEFTHEMLRLRYSMNEIKRMILYTTQLYYYVDDDILACVVIEQN